MLGGRLNELIQVQHYLNEGYFPPIGIAQAFFSFPYQEINRAFQKNDVNLYVLMENNRKVYSLMEIPNVYGIHLCVKKSIEILPNKEFAISH